MKLMQSRPKIGRIRAAILEWFGIPASYAGDSVLVNTNAGVTVNSENVLELSTVMACTRLIAETTASLPLSIHERRQGIKRTAIEHPLHFIVHDQPSNETTASTFWEAMTASMLLRGMGRAERLMVGDRLVGLAFLNPNRLTITRTGTGEKQYRYTEDNGRQRIIPASRVWEVPGFSLDGKCGVSVVRYGASTFGTALAAEETAGRIFSRGLMPTTYFKYPKTLTPPQRSEARAFIENRLSGAVNAGRPVILEAEMDVGTIGIDPNDAQLLETRKFSVEEICRWFRVPPWMVGHTEKSTSWGTGFEQQMIAFLMFTISPWLRRIEQAINKDLLAPGDRQRYYAKFAVEGLLRADSKSRAAFYSVMVNNGIFTRDEVRELEDREPMGGNASVLTVQSAMVPLDAIGTKGAQSSDRARAALQAWLQDADQDETTTANANEEA